MSQADVEMLRAGYEDPGTYRGLETITRFFDDLFEPFEEVAAEPQQFFDRGDRIAVIVVVRSRPRGSTAVVQNTIGHLWTLRDGKVVRFEIFPEREKMLEAIRVRDQS